MFTDLLSSSSCCKTQFLVKFVLQYLSYLRSEALELELLLLLRSKPQKKSHRLSIMSQEVLVEHKGGCHCGAVKFSVMAPENLDVIQCKYVLDIFTAIFVTFL